MDLAPRRADTCGEPTHTRHLEREKPNYLATVVEGVG